MIDILEDIEHDILEVSSCNRTSMYIQYPVKCGFFLQKELQFSAVNQFYKDTYGTNVPPATLTQF